MDQFLKLITEGKASDLAAAVVKTLNDKLKGALSEQRRQVAEETYGPQNQIQERLNHQTFFPNASSEKLKGLHADYSKKLDAAKTAHSSAADRYEKSGHEREMKRHEDVLKHLKGRIKTAEKKEFNYHPDQDRKKALKDRPKVAAAKKANELQHLHAMMQLDKQGMTRIKSEIAVAKKAGHSTKTLTQELAAREKAFRKKELKMKVMTKSNTGHLPESESKGRK
jgi:hypothetical protein